MEPYAKETIEIARKRAAKIAESFVDEVAHLVRSSGVDPENHRRGVVFGVALEHMADGYLRDEKKSEDYRNLTRI
jgi:hypothetical protein